MLCCHYGNFPVAVFAADDFGPRNRPAPKASGIHGCRSGTCGKIYFSIPNGGHMESVLAEVLTSIPRAVAASPRSAALSIGLWRGHRRRQRARAARADPRIRPARPAEALPSGPLEAEHRTLEIGLAHLGRAADQPAPRLCRAALHLWRPRPARRRRARPSPGARPSPISRWCARRARPARPRRSGRAGIAISRGRIGATASRRCSAPLEARLEGWAADGAERGRARGCARSASGSLSACTAAAWNEELVLERYELLYEAGLVAEAARERASGGRQRAGTAGWRWRSDHRRILATAIGRLRGKIKYRPVVFELMPPAFTLLAVAAHRRGDVRGAAAQAEFPPPRRAAGPRRGDRRDRAATGGRPARLVRFRREVLLERPAPGLRLRPARRASA